MDKRILSKFTITEISGVDFPAQEGASVLIMKRDEPSQETELELLKRQVEELQVYAEFSDAEKEYLVGLSKANKAKFVKLDANERKEQMAKAAVADPVVYTTMEGVELHKSAGEVLISLAKHNDELRKTNEQLTNQYAHAELLKRAEVLTSKLPGSLETRGAFLKAIEAIPEEEVRSAALTVLKAVNENYSEKFQAKGTAAEGTEDELSSLAKKYQLDNNTSLAKAYDEVLKTEKGQALYSKIATGGR